MEGEVSLPPGFRFHPTDEELVSYYLKRKVQRKTIRFNAIAQIDVYKSEPWDLPVRSLLKSRDLEWYFFSLLDRKYGNGSRTNRATELGFWKTTGKDRTVMRNLKIIGMKKTLVYHKGRAPHGERTNWVMHEYRLEEEGSLSSSGNLLDAYVLCRIFQKSGPGPKNGEQYGAPFVEEEWDDDEEAIVEPKMMSSFLLNYKEISPEPHVPMDVPFLVPKNEDDAISGTAAHGPSRVSLDSGQNVFDSEDFLDEIDQFLLHSGGQSDDGINSSSGDEIVEPNDHEQNLDLCMLEKNPLPAQEWNEYDEFAYPDTQILQEQKDVDPIAHDDIEDICKAELEEIYQPLENDYYLELDDLSQPVDPQSSAVEVSEMINSASTYSDAYASFPAEDGSFLEINDLSNPVDPDSSGFEMLDDLMHFFDATESNLYEFGSSSRVFEQANIVNGHPNIKSGVEETLMPDEAQPPSHVHVADQSTPKTASDGGPWTYDKILKGKRSDRIPRKTDNNPEGGWAGSLSKRVQGMLESIPAAAAEYPTKATKAGIQEPAVYGQRSIHITTAAFRISYDEIDEEPLCKTGYLSFSVKDYIYPPESTTNPSDPPAILEFSGRKAFPFFVRCCLHVFGLVMLLAVGHKLRSCICAR